MNLSGNRIISSNDLLPPQMHNRQLVVRKNSAQNARYVSGIFKKYVKSDK